MGRVTDSGRVSGARVRVANGQGWQALGLGLPGGVGDGMVRAAQVGDGTVTD